MPGELLTSVHLKNDQFKKGSNSLPEDSLDLMSTEYSQFIISLSLILVHVHRFWAKT